MKFLAFVFLFLDLGVVFGIDRDLNRIRSSCNVPFCHKCSEDPNICVKCSRGFYIDTDGTCSEQLVVHLESNPTVQHSEPPADYMGKKNYDSFNPNDNMRPWGNTDQNRNIYFNKGQINKPSQDIKTNAQEIDYSEDNTSDPHKRDGNSDTLIDTANKYQKLYKQDVARSKYPTDEGSNNRYKEEEPFKNDYPRGKRAENRYPEDEYSENIYREGKNPESTYTKYEYSDSIYRGSESPDDENLKYEELKNRYPKDDDEYREYEDPQYAYRQDYTQNKHLENEYLKYEDSYNRYSANEFQHDRYREDRYPYNRYRGDQPPMNRSWIDQPPMSRSWDEQSPANSYWEDKPPTNRYWDGKPTTNRYWDDQCTKNRYWDEQPSTNRYWEDQCTMNRPWDDQSPKNRYWEDQRQHDNYSKNRRPKNRNRGYENPYDKYHEIRNWRNDDRRYGFLDDDYMRDKYRSYRGRRDERTGFSNIEDRYWGIDDNRNDFYEDDWFGYSDSARERRRSRNRRRNKHRRNRPKFSSWIRNNDWKNEFFNDWNEEADLNDDDNYGYKQWISYEHYYNNRKPKFDDRTGDGFVFSEKKSQGFEDTNNNFFEATLNKNFNTKISEDNDKAYEETDSDIGVDLRFDNKIAKGKWSIDDRNYSSDESFKDDPEIHGRKLA